MLWKKQLVHWLIVVAGASALTAARAQESVLKSMSLRTESTLNHNSKNIVGDRTIIDALKVEQSHCIVRWTAARAQWCERFFLNWVYIGSFRDCIYDSCCEAAAMAWNNQQENNRTNNTNKQHAIYGSSTDWQKTVGRFSILCLPRSTAVPGSCWIWKLSRAKRYASRAGWCL